MYVGYTCMCTYISIEVRGLHHELLLRRNPYCFFFPEIYFLPEQSPQVKSAWLAFVLRKPPCPFLQCKDHTVKYHCIPFM